MGHCCRHQMLSKVWKKYRTKNSFGPIKVNHGQSKVKKNGALFACLANRAVLNWSTPWIQSLVCLRVKCSFAEKERNGLWQQKHGLWQGMVSDNQIFWEQNKNWERHLLNLTLMRSSILCIPKVSSWHSVPHLRTPNSNYLHSSTRTISWGLSLRTIQFQQYL